MAKILLADGNAQLPSLVKALIESKEEHVASTAISCPSGRRNQND
jgi:hypothetical protein